MNNVTRMREWSALHHPREAKRLQLVALAAEVATVASRVREQHAKLPLRRRLPGLERECRALESATLQMLFPGTLSHELSVIGDKRIPYDLLLTVLYTAGQNELENYRFVVIQKEDQ